MTDQKYNERPAFKALDQSEAFIKGKAGDQARSIYDRSSVVNKRPEFKALGFFCDGQTDRGSRNCVLMFLG